MWRVSFYIFGDLFRNRVVLGYTGLLSLVGWGTFALEGQPEKVLLVLLQVTLMALPLIVMVFASSYYYTSQEFIILLLAQPIARSTVIASIFTGLGVTFTMGFFLGLGLPLLVFYPAAESLLLIGSGLLLTWLFVALALYLSTLLREKSKGLGATLLLWAFFAFLFDGLLLMLMYQLADYPIERVILVLSMLNPIDIARILVIMKTEAAAMLGLSGAVFRDFFGGRAGMVVSAGMLLLWTAVPFLLARRRFLKKDM